MKKQVFLFSFLLLMLLPIVATAAISKDNALSGFVTGNLAYKEGDYPKAVGEYEEIIRAGRESGAVYYNLGNSYFRMREFGKAILNYERGRNLIPRDSDLNFNNKYARFLQKLPSQTEELNFIQSAVIDHIQFYTREEMVLIMTLLGVMIGIIFIVSLYFRWPRKISVSAMVSLGIVFVIFATGLFLKVRFENNLAVVIRSGESKFEPTQEATTHFQLNEGTKVHVLKIEGGWAKIKRDDGKLGWVPVEFVDKI